MFSGVPLAIISPWCSTITACQRHHRAHDVLDQQNRETITPVDRAQKLDHRLALGRTEAGHRFVEEQEFRLSGDRPGNFEPLAVRQGQSRRGQIALGAETEIFKDRIGACGALRAPIDGA